MEYEAEPLPSGDERAFTNEKTSADQWCPNVAFTFIDGEYYVWGGYWIQHLDPNESVLTWIDRLRAPIPLPWWWLER